MSLTSRKMLVKKSPHFEDGLMSMVYLLITIFCGSPFYVTADTLTNFSLGSISDQHTSYQSVPLKPATTSLSSAPVQTNTNPIIQKYAISDLTRDLNLQLKSIEDHELLIPIIQSAFDTFERVSSPIDQNDTKILNSVATKIDAKLSSALRALNETNQKFLNILTENIDPTKQLLLDAIILPCTSTSKHAERSTHESDIELSTDFIGGIDKKKAIEVLNFLKNAGHLHENDDRNFTINKRLMETLKSIDLSSANVPNFRDVFFLPRDNQISSTNCRNTVPNEHHR